MFRNNCAYAFDKFKKMCLLLLLALCLFAVYACSSSDERVRADTAETHDASATRSESDTNRVGYPLPPGAENHNQSAVRTLRVMAPESLYYQIYQAWRSFERAQSALGIEVVLEFDGYCWTNILEMDARYERLRVELMAGMGPDIFVFPNMSLYEPYVLAHSGFLADMYYLIEQCSRVTIDDFFIEPLRAHEVDGGLYSMPMLFRFMQVSINSTLPDEIVSEFMSLDVISWQQMIDIVVRLQQGWSEFGDLRMSLPAIMNMNAYVLEIVANNFFDFQTGTANFTDSEFLVFLDNLRKIHFSDRLPYFFSTTYASYAAARRHADTLVFNITVDWEMGNTLLPLLYPYFVHSIPIVDNQGRLLLLDGDTTWWSQFAIVANANQYLAWDFLLNLIDAYANPFGRAAASFDRNPRNLMHPVPWAPGSTMGSSIRREYFGIHARETMSATILRSLHRSQFERFADPAERNRAIDATLEYIAMRNEMPMALSHIRVHPRILLGPDNVRLTNFMHGIITAEQFAQEMQDAVLLWMMEIR